MKLFAKLFNNNHLLSNLPQIDEKVILESYENLKLNLMSRYINEPIRTILFTGCAPGAGVSSTAVNFAAILSKDSQFQVLLIDANLRSPNLHNILGIDHIDDLITDHGEMPSPIKVWPSSDLYILPPNGEDIDPINFYNHPGFCQLLRTMHERYDYVILDAPPPLHIFTETLILSSQVDGIVLVIEAGKIPWQVAATVKKRLEGAGGKILGVVLSKKKYYIPKFIDERL